MSTLDQILDGGISKPGPQMPQLSTPFFSGDRTAGEQGNTLADTITSDRPADAAPGGQSGLKPVPDLTGGQTDAAKMVGAPGSTPSHAMNERKEPRRSYLDLFRELYPDRPETDEQRKAREKKEKREGILAGIGDAISAFSNLFFTSQYAPNAYDPNRGMSAQTKERWEKLRKEREAKRQAYYESYLRAAAMDDANERDDRNWRHTLEREKIVDRREDAREAREKALAYLNEQLIQHQITAAEFKEEQERIKAQFAEESERLDQEYRKAGISQRRAAAGASVASAAASYAKASYYRKGGSGGGKSGPTLQLEDEEPMHFANDKDYERAVMRLAKDYGVTTSYIEVTEKDVLGNPRKQRTVKKDVKTIGAEIEREAAKRKQAKANYDGGDSLSW